MYVLKLSPVPSLTATAWAKCEACLEGGDDKPWFQHAFQPIFNLNEGKPLGHEALVRGLNGEGALHVLALVDDTKVYQFDQLCRTEAVRRASELGMRDLLFINFLPNAVYRPEHCIRRTMAACRKFNFPIERIVFEVSESEHVGNRHHLLGILDAYADMGFRTAIDDFGAGYAGLSLLRHHQPSYVKLDMELVRDVDHNPVAQSIVRGVVAMCGELGITTIAEGVETPGERDFLKEAGIIYQQGYLFARPAFALQQSAPMANATASLPR